MYVAMPDELEIFSQLRQILLFWYSVILSFAVVMVEVAKVLAFVAIITVIIRVF